MKSGSIPQEIGQEFAYATALSHGMSAWEHRSPGLQHPFRGTRIADPGPILSAPPQGAAALFAWWRDQQLQRARAYATVMPAQQFFFGVTAAFIQNLPVSLPLAPKDYGQHSAEWFRTISVGTHAPGRAPRRPGMLVRQFRPHLLTVREADGLCVADPCSLWATLSAHLRFEDSIALGDAIIRMPRVWGRPTSKSNPPHASIEDLAAAARIPGRFHRPQLLRALPHLRDGASSPPETHLRLAVVAAGLPEPQLDFDVRTTNGIFLGTSELTFPRFQIALEYEGDHHRTERSQWFRDIEKYQLYAEAGWEVVRVTARSLYRDRPRLIKQIHDALTRRGWSGAPSDA